MLNIDITKIAQLTEQDIVRLIEIDKSPYVTVSIPKQACKTNAGLAKCINEHICALYFLYLLRNVTSNANYYIPPIDSTKCFKFRVSRPLAKALAQLLVKAAAFYCNTNETDSRNYQKEALATWTAIRNKQLWFDCPDVMEFMKQLEQEARKAVKKAKKEVSTLQESNQQHKQPDTTMPH